jgi:hypothetical protein
LGRPGAKGAALQASEAVNGMVRHLCKGLSAQV